MPFHIFYFVMTCLGTVEILSLTCITGLHCVLHKLVLVKLRFASRGHPSLTLSISS